MIRVAVLSAALAITSLSTGTALSFEGTSLVAPDCSYGGKIKSIGSYSYAWYASYDRGYGGMKSGSPMQNVNGVTFLVR